jgi:hypothetical protein
VIKAFPLETAALKIRAWCESIGRQEWFLLWPASSFLGKPPEIIQRAGGDDQNQGRELNDRDEARRSEAKPRMAAAASSGAQVQAASKLGWALVLEARDFVLHPQLATFQLNDLEIVDRRMSAGISYFRFQGAMPSFQFRKMRFYGHIGKSPEPDRGRASDGGLMPAFGPSRAPDPHKLPRWRVAKGVLGYREAARRGFPRGVASSTQVSLIRPDEGRPDQVLQHIPVERTGRWLLTS